MSCGFYRISEEESRKYQEWEKEVERKAEETRKKIRDAIHGDIIIDDKELLTMLKRWFLIHG